MATTPAPSAELLVKETSQIARDGEDGGDEEALSLLLGRVVAAIPAGSTSRRRAFERLASQLGKFSTAEDINVFLRALQAVVILRPKGVDARSRDVPEDALSTLLEDEPLALLPTLTARGPPPDETTGKVWHILDGTRDLHPLVCDGMIHRDNLRWLIQELLSVTDLKRHWAEAWALLELLPRSQMEENGRTFVATLLEVMIAAPPFKISEVAGIIAFLTCSHRVQLHVVEDTLVEFLVSQGSHPPARADLTDAKVWWLVSKLLVHWFPRTKGSSWGWSRPGWTWQEWLLLTDRLLERLPEAQAFDVLKGAVEAMEDMDGEKLHAQPCWTASRLEKLRGRMRALAGLTDDAMLSARLGPLGVWGPLHAGARVQLRGLVAEVSLNGKKGVCRNYQPPGVCFTMATSWPLPLARRASSTCPTSPTSPIPASTRSNLRTSPAGFRCCATSSSSSTWASTSRSAWLATRLRTGALLSAFRRVLSCDGSTMPLRAMHASPCTTSSRLSGLSTSAERAIAS